MYNFNSTLKCLPLTSALAARFLAYKDFSAFGFAASEINEASLRQLHRIQFIDKVQNIMLIGKAETGKTHAATAMSVHTIEHYRTHTRKAPILHTKVILLGVEKQL